MADRLVVLLDLEEIEKDIFRGSQPAGSESFLRVFGGQVAGQALMAAGRTVDRDRMVHSLHAYFIRPGDPEIPIVFTVDRIRDGRSFTTRRVVAVQHGQGIFALEASFQLDQPGIDHQAVIPVTELPESLQDIEELWRPGSGGFRAPFVRLRAQLPDAPGPRRNLVWMKAAGQLPDDPLLQACALTYVSDLVPMGAVLQSHGLDRKKLHVRSASLDHSVWFHRPCRADEWLLFDSTSPSAFGSRGLGLCNVFTADGRMVATVAQEGMFHIMSDD
jgi:acyl-CoA thioesterase-2